MALSLKIGLNAIANYRRMDYEIWYALAEYVDNSTQSYANNRKKLDEAYKSAAEKPEVRITYERHGHDPVVRIVDNAMGMDYSELEHALEIALPPSDTSGRCRYGMGMKTASCWIGNRWTVTTKKLGSTKELAVEIDVEHIAKGHAELQTSTVDNLSPDLHYTRIEIRQHNREFKGRAIGKIAAQHPPQARSNQPRGQPSSEALFRTHADLKVCRLDLGAWRELPGGLGSPEWQCRSKREVLERLGVDHLVHHRDLSVDAVAGRADAPHSPRVLHIDLVGTDLPLALVFG